MDFTSSLRGAGALADGLGAACGGACCSAGGFAEGDCAAAGKERQRRAGKAKRALLIGILLCDSSVLGALYHHARRQGLYGSNAVGRLYTRERSEEHTSELQSRLHLVCRLLHA